MTTGAAKYWEEEEERRWKEWREHEQYVAGGGLLLHHNIGQPEMHFSGEEMKQVRAYIVAREEEWRKAQEENKKYKAFFKAFKDCAFISE